MNPDFLILCCSDVIVSGPCSYCSRPCHQDISGLKDPDRAAFQEGSATDVCVVHQALCTGEGTSDSPGGRGQVFC